MTLYLGNNLISGVQTIVGESRNIGQIIPSAIPLTDAGLHLLDGTLILGNGIYSSFVDYIAGLTTNYPNLFVTETEWQTSVNTYSVCGKFVYTNEISATMPSVGTLTGIRNPSSDMDAGSLGMRYAWNVPKLGGDIFTVSETPNVGDAIWVYQNGSWINSGVNIETVNHSVRLPKVTGILEGTTDLSALGDLVEAGLPFAEHFHYEFNTDRGSGDNQSSVTAAQYPEVLGQGGYSSYIIGGTSKEATLGKSSNAQWSSSSIYGNSSTVQPQTIKCHYYIVIATSTKTDIQVDIDEIATDLNSKADVDLSNISASQSAKNEIIGWGMPNWSNSISYANNTNTNTAPSDGFIMLYYVPNSGTGYFQINGQNVASCISTTYRTSACGMFVINKNDTFNITATAINDSYSRFVYKFVPMKGAN